MDTLRIPALTYQQGPCTLYTFALAGRRLPDIATLSRARRDDAGELWGYQRTEIRKHVRSIRKYLETDHARLPNALVLAFDNRVRFEPMRGRPKGNLAAGAGGRFGTLVIPLDPDAPAYGRPGWVVDGQQRMMAFLDADPERLGGPFPVCVVAFKAASEAEQREQFILVNATRPLRKSLVYEFLPVVEGPLPEPLERRRYPATLLDRLNRDADSPFAGRIRTPTRPDGYINDNAVLRMIEHALTDGALYAPDQEGGGDLEKHLRVLKQYWHAVALVFPDAWALPPAKSRLTHGAGIVALGYLMDAIADAVRVEGQLPTAAHFVQVLKGLVPVCRWTSGTWDFGPDQRRRWHEVQNVSADIHLLTYYLLRQYKTAEAAGLAREFNGAVAGVS